MRARQWLIIILTVLAVVAVVYHGGGQRASNPVRSEVHVAPEQNVTVLVLDENGTPLDANVRYVVNGTERVIRARGKATIPASASSATFSAKDHISVTIRAITNGRKVILPRDPTKIKRTLTFTGCDSVIIAPIGAPLVDRFDCNKAIQLPEGVYRFAALDKNGCVTKEGNVTLRKDTKISVRQEQENCKHIDVYVRDAETEKPEGAWISARGIARNCKDGNCYVGAAKRCVDVYAWREGYMRSYDHVCDNNTIIQLNRAVDVEEMRIKTDGDEIVVTDRDGIVIHVAHAGSTEFAAPDGSYYVFAERWPAVTRVMATVPGDADKNISITPLPARITLRKGEVAYLNDAPVCRGPKTCELPALTAIRIVDENGQERVFVALPGEERII